MACVAAPVVIELCRRRGDSFPDEFTLKDAAGVTFLTTATAIPRQRPNFTFNGAANAWSIDIHCPNFLGPLGGVIPATG